MSQFSIAISRSEFQKMDNESVDEYTKNSAGVMVFKGKKLTGTWINCVATKINEYEGNSYSILGKNGRINRQKKQITTRFFSGNGELIIQISNYIVIWFLGECGESKDCLVKYTLSIQNEDINELNGFVQINVSRIGEHSHLQPKRGQIRGKFVKIVV